MRHRGRWIELGRALERAKRPLVIEAERLRHAAVELSLGFGVASGGGAAGTGDSD
jgi:hypothetical protein